MKTKKHFRGLSGLDLKCLAMVLMVLDHLHYFFEFTGRIPLFFSQLGRLSGWLFLFCAAEGFAHTSNRKRYFLRCYGIAAAMGLIQYWIQFFDWTRADGFYPANNIFATFVLCFILWQGLDECKKKRWLPGIGLLALPWIWYFSFARLPLSIMPYAYFLQCTLFPLPFLNEGGIYYLIGGLILYGLRRHRAVQLSVFVLTLASLYGLMLLQINLSHFTEIFTIAYEWMGVFAVIFMALYNGKRGPRNQRFFYWFYPLHVYLFYLLSCLMV